MQPTGISQIAAALVLFLAGVPVQASTLAVHELKQHWQQYNGKRLQVRGQLDACGPVWFCAICPEEMTLYSYNSDLCIPFAFENQHTRNSNQVADEVDQLMRAAYRFATITVEANFSALCLYNEKGKPVGEVVCTDAPANLDYARIVEVHSRKTASDGLVDKSAVRNIVLAAPPEAPFMASEFQKMVSYGRGDPRLFLITLTPADVHNLAVGDEGIIQGVGCICLVESCEGKWPTRYFLFMNSPANSYKCWAMQKKPGGWRVLPSF